MDQFPFHLKTVTIYSLSYIHGNLMHTYIFRLCREHFSDKMFTSNNKRFLLLKTELFIFLNVNAPKISKPRRKRKTGFKNKYFSIKYDSYNIFIY